MDISQCKIGSFYQISHKRKGNFYARYAGPWTKPGYALFDILTWPGNGNEKYANSMEYVGGRKTTPLWSQKALLLELCTLSTPSTAVQKEWQNKVKNATDEFARLAQQLPANTSTVSVSEPAKAIVPGAEARVGFWKRHFGGKK